MPNGGSKANTINKRRQFVCARKCKETPPYRMIFLSILLLLGVANTAPLIGTLCQRENPCVDQARCYIDPSAPIIGRPLCLCPPGKHVSSLLTHDMLPQDMMAMVAKMPKAVMMSMNATLVLTIVYHKQKHVLTFLETSNASATQGLIVLSRLLTVQVRNFIYTTELLRYRRMPCGNGLFRTGSDMPEHVWILYLCLHGSK